MADSWYDLEPGPAGRRRPGDRWNVSVPAVVGVVFAILLGVVVWVVATSDGESAIAPDDATTTTTLATTTSTVPATSTLPTTAAPTIVPTSLAPVTLPVTPSPTSPLPMPATSAPPPPPATAPAVVVPTAPATTRPATTVASTTTAAASTTTRAPGTADLGVPGHALQRPACDGSYITVLASFIGSEATAEGLAVMLDGVSGAKYLRTDQTCPSLTQSSGGQPIWVVYRGPFGDKSAACDARRGNTNGAYVRQLSNDVPADHVVNC